MPPLPSQPPGTDWLSIDARDGGSAGRPLPFAPPGAEASPDAASDAPSPCDVTGACSDLSLCLSACPPHPTRRRPAIGGYARRLPRVPSHRSRDASGSAVGCAASWGLRRFKHAQICLDKIRLSVRLPAPLPGAHLVDRRLLATRRRRHRRVRPPGRPTRRRRRARAKAQPRQLGRHTGHAALSEDALPQHTTTGLSVCRGRTIVQRPCRPLKATLIGSCTSLSHQPVLSPGPPAATATTAAVRTQACASREHTHRTQANKTHYSCEDQGREGGHAHRAHICLQPGQNAKEGCTLAPTHKSVANPRANQALQLVPETQTSQNVCHTMHPRAAQR
jgi:hypothetical protein